MKNQIKIFYIWIAIVSCILTIAGIVFSVFGFTFFPVSILPKDMLLPWVSSIYGSVLIGWGVTLFLLGRLAFRRNDRDLMKIILGGLTIWLVIEAVISAYLGIYFNVGVDVAVWTLFGVPLLYSINHLNRSK